MCTLPSRGGVDRLPGEPASHHHSASTLTLRLTCSNARPPRRESQHSSATVEVTPLTTPMDELDHSSLESDPLTLPLNNPAQWSSRAGAGPSEPRPAYRDHFPAQWSSALGVGLSEPRLPSNDPAQWSSRAGAGPSEPRPAYRNNYPAQGAGRSAPRPAYRPYYPSVLERPEVDPEATTDDVEMTSSDEDDADFSLAKARAELRRST